MEPEEQKKKDPNEQNKIVAVQGKRKKKQALPPNLRNLCYSFLEFKYKFRMIYLCKQEYKFLGEWKLYADEEERLR